MNDADFPRPGNTIVHGIEENARRSRPACRHGKVSSQHILDQVMKRSVESCDTFLPLIRGQVGIPGYVRGFTFLGNQVRCIEWAVAIDQKPGGK